VVCEGGERVACFADCGVVVVVVMVVVVVGVGRFVELGGFGGGFGGGYGGGFDGGVGLLLEVLV
jgi:hypothetical protein